ncbi:MAG: hypothetical protein C0412_21450 [Flavobacterium sp.]|nr:hypothetical protein [Flavobacterium sp.]
MGFVDILKLILFLGGVQGLLLSLTLLTLKKYKVANRFLASLLFLFAFIMLSHVIHSYQEEAIGNAKEDDSIHNLIFLFSPLIYGYVAALTKESFRVNLKHLVHFLPFALLMLTSLILQNSGFIFSKGSLFVGIKITLCSIQFTIYLFYSLMSIREYSGRIKDSYSYMEKINLNWLKIIITAQFIIWPAALAIEILFHNSISWYIFWTLVSIFIYIIGYKSIQQPEIFSGFPDNNTYIPADKKRKYEKSTLTNEAAEAYYLRLINFMKEDMPYRNPRLTLPLLSEKLNIPVHHLSQIINNQLNQNFFEFINSYRIEDAKIMLASLEKSNYTISSIAYESGFNTLSSFNTLFKKFTGITPSQYKAQHLSRPTE